MTTWIYTGDRPSNGAKELASLPGFKRLRTGKFVKPQDTIINWGSTKGLNKFTDIWLNQPAAIATASNKLIAFENFAEDGVSVPPFTQHIDVVKEWLKEGSTVVVRNTLTGHSGHGIVILEKGETEVPAAPLYTKYIFKVKEYRVHVVNGKVIDTQQKIKDPDKTPTTWKVRSHANGFIFARNNIIANIARDDLAVSAISALGLDFGAVDIVEDKKGNLYVLEVNTAPGLEGQTIQSYAGAFGAG